MGGEKKQKILIVEDEFIVAASVERILTEAGYEVSATVATGDEALKKALSLRPDLVLMDIVLSGKMDGILTIDRIKQYLDVPFIYMTGNTDDATVARARSTEPYGYILKPIDEKDLLVNVDSALYKYMMEKKLRERDRELQLTLDATTEGIWKWDFGTDTLFFSPKYYTMLGYEPDEFPATYENWLGLIHPEDRQKAGAVVKEYLKTKPDVYQNEFRLRTKNGEYRWIDTYARVVERDERGNALMLIGNHRDITERKQAEESLHNSVLQWNATFDAITDAISIIDTEGTILRCNAAMTVLLQKPLEEIKGQYCYRLVHGTDKPAPDCPIVRMKETKKRESLELPFAGRWIKVSVDPLLDMAGNVAAAVHIITDITEQKQSEEKLKTSLAEKELLLKEIHHRVKNNLTIISSILNLQTVYVEDAAAKKILRDCEARVLNMAMIHDRLYHSRDLSTIDFKNYIEKMTFELYSSYNVNLEAITLTTDIQEIFFDIGTAIPLGFIVNELLSNAMKHAFPLRKDEEGRKAGIPERGDRKEKEIKIGLKREGGLIILIVSDNGIGFPQQVDYKNSASLGLQLVMALAKQLNATVELENDNGTTFRVTFPETATE